MKLTTLGLLGFFSSTFSSASALSTSLSESSQEDFENRIYFAVELDSSYSSIPNLSEHFESTKGNIFPSSWNFEYPITAVPNHFLFSIPKNSPEPDLPSDIGSHELTSWKLTKRSPEHELLRRHLISNGVGSLEILPPPRQLYKRGVVPVSLDLSNEPIVKAAIEQFDIHDPIFPEQWHLVNPIQKEHHINVTGVWAQNITGDGVKICVIDDGLDLDTPDLKDNFFAEGSWDFNDPGPLPRPRLSDDRHGTRCAGEIAAVKNDACGVGVAYTAKVAGVRILSKRISAIDEAKAINFAMDKNDIYSCSWGPSDNGQTMEAPPEIVKKAILNAVQNGRDKKGNIYVFASGNGGSLDDNCNFDGYTNSIYSITVAAIDRKGLHPFYSESCSANLVVTYSSGSGDYIHTTDVNGACSTTHGGTSAAAPIAAGIFSLALQANPNLTWRDLQYLAWDTAVPFGTDPNWQITPAGKRFHHDYGYGKLDAYAIVERAKTWENVNPQAWYHLPTKNENAEVPVDHTKAIEFTINVTKEDLEKSNLGKLEHIQVRVNAQSTRRGSLTISLTSPSGITSDIMPKRRMDPSKAGVRNWNFMSVAHWGESGVGEWKLTAKHVPKGKTKAVSTLLDWQLLLWGESIDPSKAVEFDGKISALGSLKSTEPEDTEPENSSSESPSQVSSVASSLSTELSTSTTFDDESTSTPISTSTSTTSESETQNSDSESFNETATATTSQLEEGNGSPSSTESAIDESAQPTESGEPKEAENKSSSFLGSLIPTFGMSKNTAAWVYGSGLLILLFIGAITGYLLWLRHKRNKNALNYKDFNPLISSHNGDEELGEELDFLDEFSLGSHSDDEHDEYDDDLPYNAEASLLAKPTGGVKTTSSTTSNIESSEPTQSPPELSVGKKAVDLYSSAELNDSVTDTSNEKKSPPQPSNPVHEETTLFHLESEDEEETPGTSEDSRTSTSGSNNQ
ncbi:uncharacterized protein SAPINGB_P003102 [Magnusiomyces paraingens]|uniref:P/Homo B domain-containing protein n=1 Tax=Magnusiomyces paraingens TaxID=2606893 RepID=A0A5E8BIF0_9ASCO|nr:uncharacterized protein SAPINGB_P003102 [Saprochaete ingens]VVT51456.1 unnamed protein product [Saprochaete ingens]